MYKETFKTSDRVYDLFCILRGKTESTRVPITTFIAKNYTDAELYLKGYILPNEKPEEYALYKIGSIDKNLKIYPCKIFIKGGFEVKYKNENIEEKKQMVLRNINKFKENFEEARFKETQADIIKCIFGGTEIK